MYLFEKNLIIFEIIDHFWKKLAIFEKNWPFLKNIELFFLKKLTIFWQNSPFFWQKIYFFEGKNWVSLEEKNFTIETYDFWRNFFYNFLKQSRLFFGEKMFRWNYFNFQNEKIDIFFKKMDFFFVVKIIKFGFYR